MTQTTLTLIRHGHTEWNAQGRYQGYAPIPLSPRGLAQAEHLAAALISGVQVDTLYSSDLLRCRQTVQPLAAALGLSVNYDARLREIDYGNWQGMTRAEAEAWDTASYQAYAADPDTVAIPGGENQAMLADRVLAILAEVLEQHAGQHVIMVTHGGPIRAMLRHYGLWGGGHPSSNASRTVLRISSPDTAALLLNGDVSHLPPELAPTPEGTTFIA